MALLTKNQIEGNLRRTASKGQISLLSLKELNAMAKKYFGIIEDGKLVGYYCPYSGLEIRSKDDLVIEHIIPVSSGGGTVLFNCIPSHKIVNGTDQKGANHLLTWWETSEYFDINRLENIVNYMFEAYDKVFEKHEINEVLTSFQSYEGTNLLEADLTTTSEEIQEKLNEQSQATGFIKYRQFLADCINTLEKNGVYVTNYQEKLNELSNKGIFKEIDNCELIQELLRKIFKEKLDEESRRELTVLLNYDIIPLIDSLREYNSKEEIFNELSKRIDNLEELLEQNNIGIISYLEDIRNCPNLLAKKTEDITNEDINTLVNEISLSVNDRFNKLIEFVEKHNGLLPRQYRDDRYEKNLGIFRNTIQVVKPNYFSTNLTFEQLQYLHNSKYESLREIYKTILNKAIDNGIQIPYVDEKMKTKILEYKEKTATANLEEQLRLEQEYSDYITVKSQFGKFVLFVIKHNGVLPREYEKRNEDEYKLAKFKTKITTFRNQNNQKKMGTDLTFEQLQYLHNSEYESLREIYKTILNKAIDNEIQIPYVDEEMKTKILEYKEKAVTVNLEEQLELELEYMDYIIVKSQFSKFVTYVIRHNGKLPKNSKKTDKYERDLGVYRSSIQVVRNRMNGFQFNTKLSKKELQYLHDSKYESLREIYKIILNEAICHEIKISYVDEKMKSKILEYEKKSENANIEAQIELDMEYKDYIVTNKFNEFISFVIENDGELPKSYKTEEKEKKLGQFRNAIQNVSKRDKFHTTLSREQLQYLYHSEYEGLREIYNTILQKAIENNISIEYYPPEYENQVETCEFTEGVEIQNDEEVQVRKGR